MTYCIAHGSDSRLSESLFIISPTIDILANGIVIKAKRMAKNSEDINQIIDYVSETLKKKLAHETTIKLKELYPNLDEDKIEKLNKLFKEN